MSYCFISRLMNHIMMIVISKFIASLFVIPKRPKFDLDSQKLKIICPNFVLSNATQGSRSCQFSKPKQTFSLIKQKKVKKTGWFWETRWQRVKEQKKSVWLNRDLSRNLSDIATTQWVKLISEFQYKFVFTSAFYIGVHGWDKAPLSMMIYSLFFLPPFCEGGAILNWNWRTIFFKWRNIKLRKQGMHLIIVFNPLHCALYNMQSALQF